MRQILLSGHSALVARVPRPAIEAGCVLVEVHYSMVSTGTELAPLRQAAQATAEAGGENMRVLTKAPYYLKKAIQNPDVAIRRLQHILGTRTYALRQRLIPGPGTGGGSLADLPLDCLVLGSDPTGVAWRKAAATKLEAQDEKVSLAVGGLPGEYQAISVPIKVPAGHHVEIAVEADGATDGEFHLGFLSQDQSNWLVQSTIDEHSHEKLSVYPGDNEYIWATLVPAPAGAAGEAKRLKLSRLVMSAKPNPGHSEAVSRNEMNDLGWNVGYSASGRVVAVGAGVDGIKIGDMVACGGAGQANHAEVISVRRNLVVQVPRDCPIDVASSATIGSIAMQGVRRADPRLGETVCVVGLGLLGLLTCQLLKASGCRVLGLDLNPQRVRRAVELGVDGAFTSPDELLQAASSSTSGHGADATIVTAAAKTDALINHAMKTTRRKGRVVIVGDIGLGMERPDLYRKEIDVLISSSYGPGRYDPAYEHDGIDYPYAYVRWTMNRNMSSFLELVAQGSVDVSGLIDETVDVDDAPDAYERLAKQDGDLPIGVVLRYPASSQEMQRGEPDVGTTSISLGGHRGPRKDTTGYVLVGAGAFGTSMLVPQMDKRKDLFDLRGVVSRDAVRGGSFARQRQLEILASDMSTVLERDDVDLVVIATRHDQHARETALALGAGKHVFVEKPLALTWDGLAEINAALQERQETGLLMVGFNRRFSPAMSVLRKTLEGRMAPLVMTYRLNGGFIPRESWIQGSQGGGRNLGEACHMYDCFRSLAGAPVRTIVASSIEPGSSNYLVNDNFTATLTYEDGSLANLVYTSSGPKTGLPKERLEVFCDGAAYVLDDYVKLTAFPNGEELWSAQSAEKGHFEQLTAFGEAIKGGSSQAPIPLDEILETTSVSLHVEDLIQGRL